MLGRVRCFHSLNEHPLNCKELRFKTRNLFWFQDLYFYARVDLFLCPRASRDAVPDSLLQARCQRLKRRTSGTGMCPALLLAGGGWVTKMQSLYGVEASEAARVWAGEVNDTESHVYSTMGYYWHAPHEFDSNRGRG